MATTLSDQIKIVKRQIDTLTLIDMTPQSPVLVQAPD